MTRAVLSAGDGLPRHHHPHLHRIDLRVGEIDAEIGGVTAHYVAPATIVFPANVVHSFSATVNGTELDMVHAQALLDSSLATYGWVYKEN